MTFPHFKQLLDDRHKKGTLFEPNGHLANDIIEEYFKHEKNLKDEFFGCIENNLNQDNIANLSYYLGFLTVNPFNETDNDRFQRLVTRAIEKLENTNASSDVCALADFVWVLLDHMLHNWTMNDEKQMIAKLREFKVSLQRFELEHKGAVALLYQKLEHFGVE